MILTQYCGLDRQLAGLTADCQRRAGREAQPVQPLRFNPPLVDLAVADERLDGVKIRRENNFRFFGKGLLICRSLVIFLQTADESQSATDSE